MLPFTPISDDTVRIKLSDSELEPLKLSIINSISFDIQKAFEARFKQLENLFDLRIQQVRLANLPAFQNVIYVCSY